jgi:Secretion system C-terminal sorting domain/CotH kinase protein
LRSVVGSPVDTFETIYDAFNNLNPSLSTYWDQADQYFDQTYYTDYIIAESWMGNTDWPQNNIKIYRSNMTNFRYRFCTIDMELALEPFGWSTCFDDHISYMMSQSTDNPFINIWLQGIQNNRFKDYFINRYADLMNTEYLPSRLLPLETDFFNQNIIEMQNEYARWGDPNNIPQQMNNLYNSHLTFQTQLTERNDQVRDHIESNFNLPNQVDLVLDVHPNGAGKIHISTIEPEDYPWNGIYFNGVPIKIEAIANPGYTFMNWGNNGIISNVLSSVYLDTLDVTAIQFDAYFTGSGLGIDETNSNLSYSVYPNPAQEAATIVKLVPQTDEKVYYQLVDISGRILDRQPLSTTQAETSLNLTGYPNALYMIQIVTDSKMLQQMRLVKIGQ